MRLGQTSRETVPTQPGRDSTNRTGTHFPRILSRTHQLLGADPSRIGGASLSWMEREWQGRWCACVSIGGRRLAVLPHALWPVGCAEEPAPALSTRSRAKAEGAVDGYEGTLTQPPMVQCQPHWEAARQASFPRPPLLQLLVSSA